MVKSAAERRFLVFGGLRIATDTKPLASRATQKKRLAALAVLAAAHPSAVTRELLASLLWPESSAHRSRRRVSSTLYELRQALGGVVIEEAAGGLRYDARALPCDVVEFEEALAGGDLETAIRVYSGPFLEGVHLDRAGEFTRWVDTQRDRFARSYAAALESLAEARDAAGDPVAATAAWRQLAAHEPYNSRIAARLMKALDAAGDRAGAILHAEEHATRLRADLELEPDPEVRECAERWREESGSHTPLELEPGEPEPAAARERAGHVTVPLTAAQSPDAEGSAAVPFPGTNARRTERAESSSVAGAAPGQRPIRRASSKRHLVALLVVGLVFSVLGGYTLLERLDPGDEDTLVPTRVLVIPFDNRTDDPELERLGELAAYWITLGMQDAGGLEVVDAATAYLVTHSSGGEAESANVNAVARSAREVRAGILVRGSIVELDGSAAFHAEVVDVREERLLHSLDPIEIDPAGPNPALNALRERVAGALATHLDPRLATLPPTGRPPPKLRAYEAFVQGLDYYYRLEPDRALERFRLALEVDTTFFLPRFWSLGALYVAGRYEGMDSLISTLAPQRLELTALERHALDYYDAVVRRDAIRALEASRAAARLAPNSLWSFTYGFRAVRLLRPQEAVEALEQLDPSAAWVQGFGPYFWTLADVYHYLGRYEDELWIVRRARAAHDSWGILIRNEFRARVALGDVEAVVAEVEAYAARPVRGAPPEAMMSQVAAELGRHGHPELAKRLRHRQLEWLARLPAEEQASAAVGIAWALTLFRLHRYEEALPWIREVVERSPDHMYGWGLRGAIAARLGLQDEVAEARARIRREVNTYNESIAWFGLALIAAAEDNHVRAAYLLERARTSEPGGRNIPSIVHMEQIFDEAIVNHPTLGLLVSSEAVTRR